MACFTSLEYDFCIKFIQRSCLQSLRAKQASLKEVQDKLQRLREKFEANTRKKQDLEEQVCLTPGCLEIPSLGHIL